MITLKEIRMKNNKSRYKLAAALDINPITLYKYETRRAIVPAWVLMKIHDIFGVNPCDVEEAYIRRYPGHAYRSYHEEEAGK